MNLVFLFFSKNENSKENKEACKHMNRHNIQCISTVNIRFN